MKFDSLIAKTVPGEVVELSSNPERNEMDEINSDIDSLNTLSRNLLRDPRAFTEQVMNELVNKIGELIHKRAFDIGELTKPSAPAVKKTARRK